MIKNSPFFVINLLTRKKISLTSPTLFVHIAGISYGFQQIGFSAATSSGLRGHGDTRPLTRTDIAILSQWYLGNLTLLAGQAGLPVDHVFTHLGGNDPPYDLHVPFSAAFTQESSPGWSFYQ